MQNISTQLPKPTIQILKESYGSTYKGVQKAVSAYVALQPKVLDELKGMFVREEIIAMADSLNSTLHDIKNMAIKEMMLAGFEDAEKYQGSFSNHQANLNEFVKKFEVLTTCQCFFLIEEIRRFWEDEGAYGSPTPDLEKLIKNLSK